MKFCLFCVTLGSDAGQRCGSEKWKKKNLCIFREPLKWTKTVLKIKVLLCSVLHNSHPHWSAAALSSMHSWSLWFSKDECCPSPLLALCPQQRSHLMLLNRNQSKYPELETQAGLTLKNERFTFHSKCIFVCDFAPLLSHNPTTKLSLFCSPTAWCNKLLHLSPAYVGFTLCWDERVAALLQYPRQMAALHCLWNVGSQ